MCNCKVGCCATQICGLLFGIINLAICTSYIIALIMLAMQCGDACYPHYFNPHLYGIIMILSAIILYLFGFLLSYFAYKRGEGDITGCNIWIVILIDIILLGTLVLCVWNLYDLIKNSNTNEYPKLYPIMVILNIIWNVLLLIITVNVLKNSQETNLKQKGSFTELSALDDHDDIDNDDLEQMISKSSVLVDDQSKKSISDHESDDEWRQDNSAPKVNAYDNSSRWQQSEDNVGSKTETDNSKTDKQSNHNNDTNNQASAYDSGFNAHVKAVNPICNTSKDTNVGGGGTSTPAFDFDNTNNAWS